MRSEVNSLDLNNLPDDYYTCRDGKEVSGDSSSSAGCGYSKEKSEEKDEAEKVYECRFCSLKFCKSQALGGHMNRHRQERETETLNKARQLVFSSDLGHVHLDYTSRGQPVSEGGFHQAATSTYRTMNPSRMYTASPPLPPPPPQTVPFAFPSTDATHLNDYFVGHVMPYGASPNGNYYTCIGAAPVSGGGDSSGQTREGRGSS